jgi:hypothetical protein
MPERLRQVSAKEEQKRSVKYKKALRVKTEVYTMFNKRVKKIGLIK